MRKHLLITALLAVIPTASFTQELESKYTEVGRFIGALGDVSFDYVGTYNNDRERSSVTIDERTGFAMISAEARSIASDGSLGNAGISVLIGPLVTGLPPSADVTVSGDTGIYVANADFDGRLALENLDFSETNLSFSFDGMLVPVKFGDNSQLQRDPDRDPINISGTFSGTPTYRE